MPAHRVVRSCSFFKWSSTDSTEYLCLLSTVGHRREYYGALRTSSGNSGTRTHTGGVPCTSTSTVSGGLGHTFRRRRISMSISIPPSSPPLPSSPLALSIPVPGQQRGRKGRCEREWTETRRESRNDLGKAKSKEMKRNRDREKEE